MTEPRIVVGMDGSPGSLMALRVALEEAKLRQAPLRVVMAWQLSWSETALETPTLVKQVEEHAAETLEAALASVDHGRGTGVEVSGELVNGHASTVLLEAAHDATLLVVGTRGTGGVSGTLVGSVAHAAIHHARCPVLVVPRTA
jgi:nucleotide-binding universal stress UspA family protein